MPVVPEARSRLTTAEAAEVDREIDAVMRAARVFSAVAAESIAQAGDSVTLPQLRVLTLATSVGSLSNSQVATALGVHISNASRICERLVQAGLLSRRDSPNDRRQVELRITERGSALIRAVTRHREAVFSQVLDQLPPDQRSAVAQALASFAAAAEPVLRIPHAHLP